MTARKVTGALALLAISMGNARADDPATGPVTFQFNGCAVGQQMIRDATGYTGRFEYISKDQANIVEFQIESRLTAGSVSAVKRGAGWIVEWSGTADDFRLMSLSSSTTQYTIMISLHPAGTADPKQVIIDSLNVFATPGTNCP